MKLSPNFTLSEFTRSATAARLHIDNTPSNEIVHRLQMLCVYLLQPLREDVKEPVIITSGYRCEELNKAVGGVPGSFHKLGMAADIKWPGDEKAKLWAGILLKMKLCDEVILERKGKTKWIHLQYSHKPRHKFISINKV